MASDRPQRAAALKAKEGNCYTDQLVLEGTYDVVGKPMGAGEWRPTHWDGTSSLVNSGGPKQRRRHSSGSSGRPQGAGPASGGKRQAPAAERCTAQSLGHAAGGQQPGRQRDRKSAPARGSAAAGAAAAAAAAAGQASDRPAKRQRGAGQSPGDAAAVGPGAAAAAAAAVDADFQPLVAAVAGEESDDEDSSEGGAAGPPGAAAAAAAAAGAKEVEVIDISSDDSDDDEAWKAEWAAAEAAADAADAAEAAAAAAERNAAHEGGSAETEQPAVGASELLPPTEPFGSDGGSGDEAQSPDSGGEEEEGSLEDGPAEAARRRSGRGAARRMLLQEEEQEAGEDSESAEPEAAAAATAPAPTAATAAPQRGGGPGRRGRRSKAAAAAQQAAAGRAQAVEDQTEFWKLECLEEDTSEQARAVAALMRANSYRGFKLWRAVRMATHAASDEAPAEGLAAPGGRELYRAGGCVLFGYPRRFDPERTLAPARILTFAELEDGLVVPVLQWAELWEDIVGRPKERIPGDEALRGKNRVWLRGLDLAKPEHLQLMLHEGTPAVNIVGHCTVRHEREILKQYGGRYTSIQEYEAAEGPHAYWYNSQRVPELLRFVDAAPWGKALPEPKRVDAATPCFADLFAGIGNVAFGFELADFLCKLAVEQNPAAFTGLSNNFPHAVAKLEPQSLTEALAAAKAGEPGFPQPGDLHHLHFSPPCQSLSGMNGSTTAAEARATLTGLCSQILEWVDFYGPASISLEEVVQFIYAKLRREPPPHMGRKAKAAAAAAAAAASGAGDDLDADGEFFDDDGASAADDAEEAAGPAAGGGGKGVKGRRLPAGAKEELRPWLYLVPALIARGYQVDLRVLPAGAYGAANPRFRCWLLAAKSGYELPQPPQPKYYVEIRQAGVLCSDDRLVDSLGEGGNGRGANLQRLVVQPSHDLPWSPNMREAIGGLPPLPMDHPTNKYGWEEMLMPPDEPGRPISRYQDWARTVVLPREGGYRWFQTRLHGHHRRKSDSTRGQQMSWDRPAGTVCRGDDANRGAHLHPEQLRPLTVLEKKLAQAIPYQLMVSGSTEEQYRQVGNAVPPPMAFEMAAVFYRSLTGREPAYQLPLLVGNVGEGRPETALEWEQRQAIPGQKGERRLVAGERLGVQGAAGRQEEEDEENEDEEEEEERGWGSGGQLGGGSSQAIDDEEVDEAEGGRRQPRRRSGRHLPAPQPPQQQQQQQPSPGRQLRLRDVVQSAPPAEPPADVILPAWPIAAVDGGQAAQQEALDEQGGQQQLQEQQPQQVQREGQEQQQQQQLQSQQQPQGVLPPSGESSGAGAAAMAAVKTAEEKLAAAISALEAAAERAAVAAEAAAARKRTVGQPSGGEPPAKRHADAGELRPAERQSNKQGQQQQQEQQQQEEQEQRQPQQQQAGLPAVEVKQEQPGERGRLLRAQQAQQEAEVIDLISDSDEEEGVGEEEAAGEAAVEAPPEAAADDAAGSEVNVEAMRTAAAAVAEREQQQPDDSFAVDIDSEGEARSDAQPGSSSRGGSRGADAAAGAAAAPGARAAARAPAAAAAADDYGGAYDFPDDDVSPEQHGPPPAHQRFSPAQGGDAARQRLLRTAGRLHFT